VGKLPPRGPGITPIGEIDWRQKVTVEGRVKKVQIGSTAGRSLEVQLFDETGGLRLLFMGRTDIPGLECGALVRATGRVGQFRGHLAVANPVYELLDDRQPVQREMATSTTGPGGGSST